MLTVQGGKRAGIIGKILLQNKADCNMRAAQHENTDRGRENAHNAHANLASAMPFMQRRLG